MKRILIFLLLFSQTILGQFIPNYKPIVNGKEDRSNKTTDTLLGTSNNYYPTQKATKTYVDNFGLSKIDKGYSISELRALSNLKVISTQIFYCNESGKESFWKYDASDNTSTDNLGYVLVTSSGKRIKRIIGDFVELSFFLTGSETDHTTAFGYANIVSQLLNKPLKLTKDTIVLNATFNISTSIIGNRGILKIKNSSSITNGNCLLNITADNVRLSDFTLFGNNSNNLGTSTNGILGIKANQVIGLKIENVTIKNTRHVGLQLTNCPNFYLKKVVVDNCGRYGTEATSAQYDRIGTLIDNSSATQGTTYFCGIESIIEECTFSNAGLDGLVLGVGIKVRKVIAFGNGAEFVNHNDGAAGIYARPPQSVSNAIIDGLEIDGCTVYSNTGLGIDIGNNAGSVLNPRVTNVKITNNTSYNNYLTGIGVASCENTILRGNICYDNGTRVTLPEGSTANPRRGGIGIDVVASIPFKNITVQGNDSYDSRSSGKTQLYGLWIGDLTFDYGSTGLVITGNDFSRNNTKAIQGNNNKSPVIATSELLVSNNTGINSFTVIPTNGNNVFPFSPHLYLNPASNLSISGINNSVIGNIISLENVSSTYTVTLTNSSSFKMLSGASLVLGTNKVAKFIYQFETGAYIWKQIPTESLDIVNTNLIGYSKPTTTRAITGNDGLETSIGLLERKFDQSNTLVATLTTGGGSDAGYYTKVASISMGSNNFQDANITLTFHCSIPSSYATVHFYMRQNTTGTATEMDMSILQMSNERGGSNQGLFFDSNSFSIINNGWSNTFDIYVKKSVIFGYVNVYEVSKSISTNSSITYYSANGWVSSLPSTTYSATSSHNLFYTKSRNIGSSSLTLAQNDYIIYVTPTTNLTFTLPSASVFKDKSFWVKKADNSVYTITLVGTIESTTNYVISNPFEGCLVHSNGTDWRVLSAINRTYISSSTATLNFPLTLTGMSSDLTMTLTGAVDGDNVIVTPVNAVATTGGSFFAYVSATNTVTVRFTNTTGASLDPASGTFKATIIR